MHPIIGSMLQKIQTEIRPNGVKNKRAAPAYKLGAIEGKCELIWGCRNIPEIHYATL